MAHARRTPGAARVEVRCHGPSDVPPAARQAERRHELQKFVRARAREGRRVREALEGGLPDRLDGSPARFLE